MIQNRRPSGSPEAPLEESTSSQSQQRPRKATLRFGALTSVPPPPPASAFPGPLETGWVVHSMPRAPISNDEIELALGRALAFLASDEREGIYTLLSSRKYGAAVEQVEDRARTTRRT